MSPQAGPAALVDPPPEEPSAPPVAVLVLAVVTVALVEVGPLVETSWLPPPTSDAESNAGLGTKHAGRRRQAESSPAERG
jgi:hypothetical protein